MKLRKAYRTEKFFRRIEERTADDPRGEQRGSTYTWRKGVQMKGDVGMETRRGLESNLVLLSFTTTHCLSGAKNGWVRL